MRYKTLLLVIVVFFFVGFSSTQPIVKPDSSSANIPVGTPLESDSSGKAANAAEKGVVHVICLSTLYEGTGFLHKSGVVITAAHVVAGCTPESLSISTASSEEIGVTSVSADDVKDLAILRPTSPMSGPPLAIAPIYEPRLGIQMTTWGYPGGYDGTSPLLSVGYFAGVQDFYDKKTATTTRRWVINAAFNGGNSGGPLFSVENEQVVGVVVSKLAPLPKKIAVIIEELKNQTGGFHSGRSQVLIKGQSPTDSQLAGYVLEYLRTQVQLVIGYAVTTKDLTDFLKAQGIVP